MIHVPASAHADLARFHAQRFVERHRPQVVHLHLRSQRDHLAQLVHFAHGLIENGGDDAAMAVSRRSGVALIQAEAANEHPALLVEGKFQMHAGRIVRPAGKAFVLRQAKSADIVTAAVRFPGHRQEILYLSRTQSCLSLCPPCPPWLALSLRLAPLTCSCDRLPAIRRSIFDSSESLSAFHDLQEVW